MKIPKFKILFLIFLLGLVLRFIYFPNDINFAYDQARDAFVSQKILQGDIIAVGPPSTLEGIHHGALFYYFFAPIYWIADGSPVLLSAILRIFNALGILFVYKITKNLFNKNSTAYLASFIFATSFEQTQLALFLAHPSPAVTTILISLWGMSEFLFNKKQWGLLVASFFLGLSTQFHFSMFIYFLSFMFFIVFFRRDFSKLKKGLTLTSLFLLTIPLTSFLVVELKFGFNNSRNTFELVELITKSVHFQSLVIVTTRYFRHNIINISDYQNTLLIIITSAYLLSLKYLQNYRKQILFLSIWFIPGLVTFLADSSPTPHYINAMGNSVALIVFFSWGFTKIYKHNKFVFFAILTSIIISNFKLIKNNNIYGTIAQVNAQTNMNLGHQKGLINYVYNNSEGKSFSINAVTIPYNVNTTWSYLFEWYGQKTYGYVPMWAGKPAAGFEGSLEYIDARSAGPQIHFLIIEPLRGISQGLVERYISEENIFTKVVEEKQFGELVVQKRVKHIVN